ncbi:MAG: spermidine synthase [Chthoniobacterales bacterium]
MSKLFAELDFQPTELGDLILRRRLLPSLGDVEVFEVKLGDAFLMSSLFHEVEEALAHLGLGELKGGACDVVVGGLGLGYTARAALAHAEVRSLLVLDALQPVIDWHQRGLVPLGAELTSDSRCRLERADFFARAISEAGFSSEEPGKLFDAVLLDIDHSPRDLLSARNASFYSTDGLRAMARHLRPGGVFAMWSDEAPDEPFMQVVGTGFESVRAHVVTFPNPLCESVSAGTVYVARTGEADEGLRQ